ncbi:N-acetylglucosamine kinase [Nakamurella lactea]|uniref:N-acetylglucosamine kinase n=1 Tax=Nakamurella lactea TaxID=459515 RepID=UPI001B7F9CE7|nr:BadF/BadG/BcrA/BcrD ATPase family protein [Nakamurella lactea]
MTDDIGATVLALDGGNSKTDGALVAADGSVLARLRGPGFRPHLGKDRALRGLATIARDLLDLAGLPRASMLSACLANSDLPEEDQEFAAWFSDQQLADRVHVTNDVFALLRSGTRERAAVTVVCGAGMNCVGIAPDGRTVRFLALGTFTGDWGGGGTLAEQAMFWAMRAEDGRGAPTALADAVPRHFGHRTTQQVAVDLHVGAIDRSRLHELVPVLFEVADAGDAIALSVVRRQADEVIAFAMAALTRLELLDTDTVVVLGGGVLAAGHRLLQEPITAFLADHAPRATVTIPQITPIVGAVLIGLEQLADGRPVSRRRETRIRSTLGEQPPAAAVGR